MSALKHHERDPQSVESASYHYRRCLLCEHRCCVNRVEGDLGHCKASSVARLFRHRIETGEELELIPSHLFYLSGCDLRCAFCIAGINAFDPSIGQELTPQIFNAAVSWGIARGARNIQWVGGEPTIHLPAILGVMAKCSSLPPVVWKSDFFGTPEAFALLRRWVDVYVADFKFGNDLCAKAIARVNDYVAVVTRNLRIAAAQSDLIVRHLLLPGHFHCCFRPIVDWMKCNLPHTKFSLRNGYLPKWRASRIHGLNQPLDPKTGELARQYAVDAGLRLVS